MGTVNTDTKRVRDRSSYNQTITVVIDTVRFISMDGYWDTLYKPLQQDGCKILPHKIISS